MKPNLLSVLCCPLCLGALEMSVAREVGGEIMEGALRCRGCSRAYPVRGGVPRMIPQPASVDGTKRAFQRQWSDRLAGRAEPRSIVFAQDVAATVGWILESARRALLFGGPGGWCLDAGCGSAEKTREFAARAGAHNMVGMDLSDTLEQSAAESRNMPNLHFVQGDIFHPPFRDAAFTFAVSYAVLHHTADTARAFRAIARKVAGNGTFLTWIYPLASDYPGGAYKLLYRQRDWHFLKLARHLPPRLCRLWCQAYVALLLPVLLPLMKRVSAFGEQCERYRLTLKQQYDAAVFYTYDNVAPYYQHRHGLGEVLEWYAACQFDTVDSGYPGLYIGHRTLRGASRPAEIAGA